MKTKTITLYSFNELSDKAKEKAHAKWIELNDYSFLSDDMAEYLHGLLEENKIKDVNDTSKPNTKPTPVLYSLSNSQGDGVCFEGEFIWKQYTIYIKHHGRYYHSNSVSIEMQETDNLGFHMDDEHEDVKEFYAIYQKICKELERRGYDYIEYEDSMEAFEEACEANDYTFREDGTMENI